jgi:hypothetical protein
VNNRIFAGALITITVLFLGAGLVLGAEESGIAITNANFVATSPEKENLVDEWVEISNLGSENVSLAGWTLEDAQNHTYSFPDFSLNAGAQAKIRTGMGMN